LLNGKPIYLRGFGMHEDAAWRGKGHDDVRMARDFALLRWIGANSFRTSHYPKAEEVLDLAYRLGFLVIDETAAVMWSVANEPDTTEPASRPYFAALAQLVRDLDGTRPVAFANVAVATPQVDQVDQVDQVTDLFDVILLNRYFGCYVDAGDLITAERRLGLKTNFGCGPAATTSRSSSPSSELTH
jgi:beta-glucuronidase